MAYSIVLNQPLKKNCVACESSDIRFFYNKKKNDKEYSIWKCKNCGSGFLNPCPTQDFLKDIYSRSGHGLIKPISFHDVLSAEKDFPNSTIDAKRMVGRAYQFLEIKSQPKALDIGSGYGFYSATALSLGYSVVAVNPSIWENDVYEQMNGFRPIQSLFEDLDFGNERFETIIMSQVLEHVQQPFQMLEKARKLLSQGGIITIAVPNIESFRVKMLGYKDDACFWVPEHLNYFSKLGLRYLLESVGFRILGYTSVSRISYTSISNKFSLRGWASTVANKLVRVGQVLPLNLVDWLGLGVYHNFWAKKIEG